MATIVTRSGKGSPLTNTEVDANFTNLNTELGTKANTASLATVATSGAYADLTGRPTNVSSFSNDSGYITGITSSNVTTALGYTPYNATNPSGYITSAALTPYALKTGAAFTGAISSTGSVTAPLFSATSSGAGSVYLNSGTASNTGYISFWNAAGVRQSFIGYSTANNNLIFQAEGSTGFSFNKTVAVTGGVTSSVGVHAPIFYDSDNTAFYADLANTNLSLNVAGYIEAANVSTNTQPALGVTRVGGYGLIGNRGVWYLTNGGGEIQIGNGATHNASPSMTVSATAVTSLRDFYAPIFYDSSNTTYYVDPAATGTAINVAGKIYGVNEFYTSTAQNSWGFRATTGASSNSSGLWFTGETAMLLLRDSSGNIITRLSADSSTANNHIGGNPIFHDGYHPNADKWTTARTLSLSGDATGSVSWDGSANVTLPVAVVNDSHEHDGRYYTEGESDARFYRYLGALGNAVDLDALQTTGRHHQNSNAQSNGTGYPTARAGLLHVYGDSYKYQQYQTYDGNDLYFRTYYQSWSSWKTIIHSGNYTSYAMPSGSSATNSVDVRAPIFYDSNNTAYYADLSSTSSSIRTAGPVSVGTTSSAVQLTVAGASGVDGIDLQVDASNAVNSARMFWTNGTSGQGTAIYNSGGHLNFATGAIPNSTSGASRLTVYSSGYNQSHVQFRAPIFYDSDNTGYYTDPTSTSVLHSLNIKNGSAGNILQAATSGNDQLTISGQNYTHALNLKDGYNTSSYAVISGGYLNQAALTVYGYSAQNVINNTSYYASSYATVAGIITATADVRAPIFYDSGNTGYYVDPASTSALNIVTTAGYIQTYSGGVKWDESGTRSWSMYPSGGAMLLNSGDGAGSFNLGASGGVRAPIFYDSNNTGYYTDPASTSNLNALNVNGSTVFRSDWTTRFQSGSDFVDGTLVTTDIPATAWAGDSFVIEITGKTYDQNNPPVKVVAQGYLYNDTIINYSGISYAGNFASYVKVFQDGGVLKFWWPRISYWNSFNVNVMSMDGPSNNTITRNRVTAIGNSTEPTGTKKVQINLTKTLKTGDAAGSISGFNNPTTAPTANTIVYRDSIGDIAAREIILSSGLSTATPTVLVSMFPTTNQLVRTTPTAVAAAIQGAATGRWNVDVTAANDVRAPIFYDSNNTAYYVDPATGFNFLSTGVTYTSTGSGLFVANPEGSGSTVRLGAAWNRAGSYSNGSYTLGSESSIHFWISNLEKGYIDSSSNLFMNGSVRAPVFYDSNNTAFYVDPATGSSLSGATFSDLITGRSSPSTDVNTANDTGSISIRGSTTTVAAMSFHRAGAYAINMGLGTDNVFRIGGWSASSNAFQMDGAGNTTALASSRAPIFYDSNDTAFYIDPNSTSHLNDVRANIYYQRDDTNNRFDTGVLALRSASPTVYFRDTDNNSAMLHCNSNLFYVLRGGNDTETWATVNGHWPLQINLTNNDAQFGGVLTAITDMRAPIFYDSNNTGFYLDPNSTGTSLNVAGSIIAAGNVTAYSDIRIKANVETIPSALDKLDQIRGVTYTRTDLDDKEQRYAGVIAQEIEKVLPEAVRDLGNIKAVDYNATIGLLIQAVKELRDEVEAMKSRLH